MEHARWTAEDEDLAGREGWCIGTADGSDRHDPDRQNYELMAIYDGQVFDGDEEAWRHVCQQALSGSRLHLRALDHLAGIDPREAREIQRTVPYARRAFAFAIDQCL